VSDASVPRCKKDEDAFWRKLILPEEDQLANGTVWRGGPLKNTTGLVYRGRAITIGYYSAFCRRRRQSSRRDSR
jgi:hypothetical protein